LTRIGSVNRSSFGEEVARGLTQVPKSIPSRFFYDDAGSALFEQICSLPEYYPTRSERSILEKRAPELPRHFEAPVTLVELGSGSATKTRLVIEALLASQAELRFVPIDISGAALEGSARQLISRYPSLRIDALEAEYEPGFAQLDHDSATPRLLLWLGSSIGNLHREEAGHFLSRIRENLDPSDRLLVGIDLRKERRVLEQAYDDRQGVTAAFNRNLLARIDAELGGDFALDAFAHRAVYREEIGRVEMHLDSVRAQRVRIQALGLEVDFADGESIHTENSYKYSVEEIERLAEQASLATESRWLDADGLFSLNLFSPC